LRRFLKPGGATGKPQQAFKERCTEVASAETGFTVPLRFDVAIVPLDRRIEMFAEFFVLVAMKFDRDRDGVFNALDRLLVGGRLYPCGLSGVRVFLV